MTVVERIKNMFKYLDKSGLKRVSDIIKKWYRRTFTGSQEEWDALTPAQKAKYEVAHIKGAGDGILVVDDAELDNMNPITSNGVYKERYRGRVPAGVSIDDMVGTEWVGTWVTFSSDAGTHPNINGSAYPTSMRLTITVGEGVGTMQELEAMDGQSLWKSKRTWYNGAWQGWVTKYPEYRGVVPDGVSIDDMVGPEWVGTWYVPNNSSGHFPMVAGTEAKVNALLKIWCPAQSTDDTVQEIYPDSVRPHWQAMRMYRQGWLLSSETPVVNYNYGGWRATLNSQTIYTLGYIDPDGYKVPLQLRTNERGDLYLWTGVPAILIPSGTQLVAFSYDQVISWLFYMGVQPVDTGWLAWNWHINYGNIKGSLTFDGTYTYMSVFDVPATADVLSEKFLFLPYSNT